MTQAGLEPEPERSFARSVTAARKGDHIRINLEEDVGAKGVCAGFDDYRFLHRALPEVDLSEVTTELDLFGRRLSAPLLISCMTGGTEAAATINRNLAEVAQAFDLPMGLGSGRVLLEQPEVLPTFDVRPVAPDILLFANLGAVQLNRAVDVDSCRRLLDLLQADCLVLHLNPLQEAIQPEGDTTFRDLLPKIESLCRRLERPVIVKEVGWGISSDLVRRLFDAGVSAVDVAGAGGTSWSEVESHRVSEPWRARMAAAFAGWGIPTAQALREARAAAPNRLVFASGGVRNGIDLAKAVALGADLVGIASPFLKAAAEGPEAVADVGRELIETLRVTMFCIGARSLREVRGTPRLLKPAPAAFAVHAEQLEFATSRAGHVMDITPEVEAVVARSGVLNGQVHVFSNHTTCAVRINENEELLFSDFERFLERLAPPGGYEHDDLARRTAVLPDEPINGHSHCRHLVLSSSESVPLHDGRLALGPWQRVLLLELCHARDRCVTVQVIGA
jgi:isopentenyl-diphosphate delta-isomerase